MNLVEFNSRDDEDYWPDKYLSEKYTGILNHITILFGNDTKFTGVSDDELSSMSREELVDKLKEEYIRGFCI